jgi:hypothetical protein
LNSKTLREEFPHVLTRPPIIGISHDRDLAASMPVAPLVYPSIKAVMQEDICQERADTPPCGAPLSVGFQTQSSKYPASSMLLTRRSIRLS